MHSRCTARSSVSDEIVQDRARSYVIVCTRAVRTGGNHCRGLEWGGGTIFFKKEKSILSRMSVTWPSIKLSPACGEKGTCGTPWSGLLGREIAREISLVAPRSAGTASGRRLLARPWGAQPLPRREFDCRRALT